MAEQELDLLEVAAGLGAELGAGAAQVVGRELAQGSLTRVLDDDVPDRFSSCMASPVSLPGLRDRPEEHALGETGREDPFLDADLDRSRHRHRTPVVVLADQVQGSPSGLPAARSGRR